MSFYGIYIPSYNEIDRDNVFTDKREAFQLLKTQKDARLKEFRTNEEAVNFSRNGFAILPVNTTSAQSPSNTHDKSPFRGPKSQELVAFRKSIEQGKLDVVRETIWNNPRYLIGCGDTPTILKEGTRYNALHVAVLAKNAKMCELLLKTVGDPLYIELIHGKNNPEICNEISLILLDLYLNMPEKGRNETPLHLAVKFGCVEVVEVLTSYAKCTYSVNSDGKYPKDIICFRCPETSNKDVFNQISELLEDRFYVPVIRSVDNSIPPIIGEPFSPSHPPNFVSDPLSPDMQIHACAGPMTKERAETFRKRWKTPPRVGRPTISPSRSPIKSNYSPMPLTPNRRSPLITPRKLFSFAEPNSNNNDNYDNNNLTSLSFDDEQNKLSNDNESTCTSDGNSNNVPNGNAQLSKFDLFNMYRSRPLIDLNDSTGSSVLSDRGFNSPMYAERHVKLSDTEKGLEMIGREIAKDHNVKWQEFWSFLGDFADISSPDGLNKLENHLRKAHDRIARSTTHQDNVKVSNLCGRFGRLECSSLDRETDKIKVNQTAIQSFLKSLKKSDLPMTPPSAHTVPDSFSSPYSCVEKSCQVYSKRLAISILYNVDSVISINDVLKSELKRLSSLISSYKGDARFYDVNFQATHSRFAGLIVHYLMANNCDFTKFKSSLRQIFESTKKIMSEPNLFQKESHFMNVQEICVLSNMLRILDNDEHVKGLLIPPEVITTEQDYTELWQSECKCECEWNNEKSRHQRRSRPKFPGSNFSLFHNENDSSLIENEKKFENTQQWRNSPDDSDDEDDFYTDAENSDDDDDIFYTPPSSPTQFILYDDELSDQSAVLDSYSTYLLGDEPTKSDVDVLNALKNVDIDKSIYPHIFQWRNAISQHTSEEIENFPSPCVIVKGRRPSNFHVPKLFQSPINDSRKAVRFGKSNILATSSYFSSSYTNDEVLSSPLARLNISPLTTTTSNSICAIQSNGELV